MEKYTKYSMMPSNVPKKVTSWKLNDSAEGFVFKAFDIADDDVVLKIAFDTTYAFLSVDERNRLVLWSKNDSLSDGVLFTVENSAFLADFHKSSLYTNEDEKITHYLIVTTDDCIDILSVDTPEISVYRE